MLRNQMFSEFEHSVLGPPLYWKEASCFRSKLPPFKMSLLREEILFYIFYSNVGDILQLAAAAEL